MAPRVSILDYFKEFEDSGSGYGTRRKRQGDVYNCRGDLGRQIVVEQQLQWW